MEFKQPSNLEATLENYLREHIPITSAMGIGVEHASAGRVILSAPISSNINHKNTVFGGSLHAVATLACWSLLYINLLDLHEENVQIVITSSQVEYPAPVVSDFKAECCTPPAVEWERFLKMLHRKGKGRLKLSAKIFEGGQLCVDYTGDFVAIKMKSN